MVIDPLDQAPHRARNRNPERNDLRLSVHAGVGPTGSNHRNGARPTQRPDRTLHKQLDRHTIGLTLPSHIGIATPGDRRLPSMLSSVIEL
jgi:hypothetical protein